MVELGVKKNYKVREFVEKKLRNCLVNKDEVSRVLKQRELIIMDGPRSFKYYQQKIKQAKKLVPLFAQIKWIKMVAITGSVASGRPKIDDDIDVCIICQNNSLWISRLVLYTLLIAHKLPFRRLKGRQDGFCFNLWLEERSMKVVRERRNVNSAIEAAWMKVIYKKDRNYPEVFWARNKWLKKYVKITENVKFIVETKSKLAIKILNQIAYIGQKVYMKNNINQEIVTIDKAYFHPQGKICFDKMRR